MKKRWILATLFLLLLSACASKQIVQEQSAQRPINTEQPKTVDITLPAEFKITSQYGVRFPASINGTVKNIGKGAGSVKIIGRVYYSGNVATERSQIIENIKPDEEVKFGIPIDKTVQWDGYSVVTEKIN